MNSSPSRAAEPAAEEAPPAAFTLHGPGLWAGPDARFDESLMALAADGQPVASIWQTQRCLVVPRTYRRFNRFGEACARFAAAGWPVDVRLTGGGIVPQGPGIVNLSLAYRVQGPPLQHSEPGYRLICRLLAEALGELGVNAFPASVDGSFCDGRYNLAVRRGDAMVKIAGTAQMWRRLPGMGGTHVGLVHGLVLLETDTAMITDTANAFESAAGGTRRYLTERVVSAAELLDTRRGLVTPYVAALERAVQGFTRL